MVAAPLPPWSYPEARTRAEFMQGALAAVRDLPGVSEAAAIAAVPFIDHGAEVALESENTLDRWPVGVLNTFTDGYFATTQIPVLEGALPNTRDIWEGSPTAVVSASLARMLWPGERAVGKQLRHAAEGSRSPVVGDDQEWLEVVAVVGDVRQAGLAEDQRPQIYVPFGRRTPQRMVLVIRSVGDPLSMASAVQRRIHQIDATLPFHEPTTLELARQISVWTERLTSRLLSGFGALALMLACVEVYGVMAFLTGQRDRELGLRMALGASGPKLQRLIVRGALGVLAPGLVAGIVGAGIVSIVFQKALFGVPALALSPWASRLSACWASDCSPLICRRGGSPASTRRRRCARTEWQLVGHGPSDLDSLQGPFESVQTEMSDVEDRKINPFAEVFQDRGRKPDVVEHHRFSTRAGQPVAQP